ncbi:DUF3224 domain-containing protein [Nonomuraea sp. NPDC050663]|uniref:DUF3224 domain-containing protein n=1 Tax=Nonomuraea soli TaxID=1032476 RepID=A0A7W0CQD9_9ACTN|nr:DUF3224 domain-containing protein [Nonomuraea soli]MBA2895411.1 hypothetical protein [Nonomuraea soli]NUT44678.1 DUF3224 domain-containing protein [Thermoactinospora sp.]
MTTQGKGTYQVTGWDEKPYSEKKGQAKLTKAHFTNTFTGDIEGEGTSEYLMVYPSDTSATFVGLQQVVGSVKGRKGTFVLQATGTFEEGLAKADWSVVPDSGTEELAGLKGKGGYVSKSDGSADFTLNFTNG